MLKTIIFIVSSFWTSSLADFSLSCHPLTPTCPGTVVNCQCNGAAGSLTWNVSSERSSCRVQYFTINTESADISGDCGAVTTDVSTERMDSVVLVIFNSNFSINLTESVTVSCGDINSIQMQNLLQLASVCLIS